MVLAVAAVVLDEVVMVLVVAAILLSLLPSIGVSVTKLDVEVIHHRRPMFVFSSGACTTSSSSVPTFPKSMKRLKRSTKLANQLIIFFIIVVFPCASASPRFSDSASATDFLPCAVAPVPGSWAPPLPDFSHAPPRFLATSADSFFPCATGSWPACPLPLGSSFIPCATDSSLSPGPWPPPVREFLVNAAPLDPPRGILLLGRCPPCERVLGVPQSPGNGMAHGDIGQSVREPQLRVSRNSRLQFSSLLMFNCVSRC